MGVYCKTIRAVVVVLILVAFYQFVPIPEYMGVNKHLSALTHHFFHANIVHLITNCYVAFMLLSRNSFVNWWVELLIAFLVASLSYYTAINPTIGFSDILYAVIGLRTPPIYHPWWKKHTTILFIAFMLIYLFIPNISALTHIISFVSCVVISGFARAIGKTNEDYGKAKRKR